MEPEAGTPESSRARALIAIGALVAFGVLITIVLLATSGSEPEREFAAAPGKCMDLWNSDEQAVSTGLHNVVSHGYSRVQIAYASEDGSGVSAEPVEPGGCVIIFAASQLDPEPIAAAEIYLHRAWTPLSTVADPARLAELQSAALAGANAQLTADGQVEPL